MIPYIQSNNKNIINCNCDLAILDNNNIVLLSLCDIHIKNKKICSDLISNSYDICLKDREDLCFEKSISSYNNSFRFKSEKMEDNLTHTILYNTKVKEYCIDWNNEGKVGIITKYLRNICYLPVDENIVSKVIFKDDENKYCNIVTEILVYTNNPAYKNLKVYKVNEHWFKQELNKIQLEGFDDNFNWSDIKDIEDYIFTFLDTIKEKLSQNIKVLYNPKNINPKMFEGNKKPFDGQIPIIQSALEVLKNDKFVYLAAEQGVGKTLIGSKINHCYLNNKNYITLILAPAITLSQWEDEIKDSIPDKINIFVIKKTIDFIKIYNESNFKFNKPTYFIVGKETFKLDSKRIPGVNIKTRNLKFKKEIRKTYWSDIREVEEKITIACCPDCGIPLKNELRKKEDIFLTKKDFEGNPKKSNYKCSNCNTVLWQNTYDKTKKSSLIRFIKTKNIHFDSIICDEIHEQNNGKSIIGNATRTLFNYTKKVILLSGTSNNGYASSMHNLLLGLLPNKLIKNEVLDIEKFIKTYGTLMAISKRKDGEYYRSGRSEIKDSEYKEIEGINPIVFTKYLSQNYIFATLDDLSKDLPKLNEYYIPINQNNQMEINEQKLWNDIKNANSFNSKMYESTIIPHYINNPFNWDKITIKKDNVEKDIYPINLKYEDILLDKELELLKIIKQEMLEGRKCCIYVGYGNGGEYMQGETLPNRIEKILKNNQIKTLQLKASVSTYDRKELLDKKKNDFDVLITNPLLVQVGLNITYIPTYINYIPSYFVNTVTQSNRRGYRANTILENRIYHLYYENSCENSIIKRFQRKYAESKAINGQFNLILENDNTIRTASKLGKKLIKNIDKKLK